MSDKDQLNLVVSSRSEIHQEICVKIIGIGEDAKKLELDIFGHFYLRGNISLLQGFIGKLLATTRCYIHKSLQWMVYIAYGRPHTTTNWLKYRSKNFWHHQQCKTGVTSLGLSLDSEKHLHMRWTHLFSAKLIGRHLWAFQCKVRAGGPLKFISA